MPPFHSPQNGNRKLAARAFKYRDWMKVLAASLRLAMNGKEPSEVGGYDQGLVLAR